MANLGRCRFSINYKIGLLSWLSLLLIKLFSDLSNAFLCLIKEGHLPSVAVQVDIIFDTNVGRVHRHLRAALCVTLLRHAQFIREEELLFLVLRPQLIL